MPVWFTNHWELLTLYVPPPKIQGPTYNIVWKESLEKFLWKFYYYLVIVIVTLSDSYFKTQNSH